MPQKLALVIKPQIGHKWSYAIYDADEYDAKGQNAFVLCSATPFESRATALAEAERIAPHARQGYDADVTYVEG